jgi:hypothetical protein
MAGLSPLVPEDIGRTDVSNKLDHAPTRHCQRV